MGARAFRISAKALEVAAKMATEGGGPKHAANLTVLAAKARMGK